VSGWGAGTPGLLMVYCCNLVWYSPTVYG